MGICSSCESTSVATAKLILQDGRLMEFSSPVKVSYLLQKDPGSFICNSDEMEFDDVVSPVSDDEELQMGQLYFALPLSRLRRPLQVEEMAALAVKANSALVKGGVVTSVLVSKEKKCSRPSRRVADVGDGGSRRGRSSSGVGGGRRGSFKAMLSAIPE